MGKSSRARRTEHRTLLPAPLRRGRAAAGRRRGDPGRGAAAHRRHHGHGGPTGATLRLACRLGRDRGAGRRPRGDRARCRARRRGDRGRPRRRGHDGARGDAHQALGTSRRGEPDGLRRLAAQCGRSLPDAHHFPHRGGATSDRPARRTRLPLAGPGGRSGRVCPVVPRRHHAARDRRRGSRSTLAPGRRAARCHPARSDARPDPALRARALARRNRRGTASHASRPTPAGRPASVTRGFRCHWRRRRGVRGMPSLRA